MRPRVGPISFACGGRGCTEHRFLWGFTGSHGKQRRGPNSDRAHPSRLPWGPGQVSRTVTPGVFPPCSLLPSRGRGVEGICTPVWGASLVAKAILALIDPALGQAGVCFPSRPARRRAELWSSWLGARLPPTPEGPPLLPAPFLQRATGRD